MLWMEIHNTLVEVKLLLAQARAYKAAEPPDSDNDELTCYTRLHAHFEKMYRFNMAVIDLMRVQDLVVRLLFENFDGDLIAPNSKRADEWEKQVTNLREAQVGLQRKLSTGAIGEADYDAITAALAAPSRSPHQKLAVEYRNKIAHRIRPSVDYVYPYAHLQKRNIREIRDEEGKLMATEYLFGGAQPDRPEYYFSELYPAIVEHLKGVIEMVSKLKSLPCLS